jgi:hypothetical protein
VILDKALVTTPFDLFDLPALRDAFNLSEVTVNIFDIAHPTLQKKRTPFLSKKT